MRRGHDLDSERIVVANRRRNEYRPFRRGTRSARHRAAPGRAVRRTEQSQLGGALRRAGITVGDSKDDFAALGFFACEPDLEAVATRPWHRSVICVGSWGQRSARKIRYGASLVASLALDRVPPSLDRVLVYAQRQQI